MTEKKTPTFEEYSKALMQSIAKGYGGLRPYQRESIEQLTKGHSGDKMVLNFPRYHAGGTVSPSKLEIRPILDFGHVEVRKYRNPRPRTDDMIQMLADFERHGYPRRVNLVIAIQDNISRVVEGLALDFDKAVTRIMRAQHRNKDVL